MAAANHYDKHPDFPKINPNGPLTVEQYFDLGRKLVNDLDKMTDFKWSQDGTSMCMKFKCPERGAIVIVGGENNNENISIIATLMQDKVVQNVAYYKPEWDKQEFKNMFSKK